MKVKVCLHNHSFKSKNSINTIDDFEKAIESGKLDKIAITDHNYFNYAKESQTKLGADKIVLGEEITTKEGEIIGLFLRKFIPSGLTAERTCQLIKAQDGVVYIPHPFGSKGLKLESLENIKDSIDVVEVFNGWQKRSIAKPFASSKTDKKAEEWAKENNLPGMSGTDSHYPSDIGTCYTEMEDFTDKRSFLNSLNGNLELVKKKNKITPVAFRTWVKGRFGRDLLRFIK